LSSFVASGHARGQAVHRVVGDGDGVVLGVGMINRTGPKISSTAMVMSGVTLENTVGCTKYPVVRPSGASGPLVPIAEP
jgi:hypothetical protein